MVHYGLVWPQSKTGIHSNKQYKWLTRTDISNSQDFYRSKVKESKANISAKMKWIFLSVCVYKPGRKTAFKSEKLQRSFPWLIWLAQRILFYMVWLSNTSTLRRPHGNMQRAVCVFAQTIDTNLSHSRQFISHSHKHTLLSSSVPSGVNILSYLVDISWHRLKDFFQSRTTLWSWTAL